MVVWNVTKRKAKFIVFKDMIMVISLVVQKVHGNRMVPLDNVGQNLVMKMES